MLRKKKKQTYTPCFVFTPETIKLAQEALKAFEQPLERADHQLQKVQFAEETLNRVKGKLDAMRTSVGRMILTTFDHNEKVILVAAIQMHSFDLSSQPASPRREKALRQCRQIAAYFVPGNPEAQQGRRGPGTRGHR
jgi:hypothetical protein